MRAHARAPARILTPTAFAATLQLLGCTHQSPATLQPDAGQQRAPFSVSATSTTAEGRSLAPLATAATAWECAMTLRAEGTVYQRANDLEVVIPRASVAVTRVNDKRIDDLKIQIGIGGRPSPTGQMVLLHGTTPRIVAGSTVDSTGPELTTWQSSGTLRLLMSRRRTPAPQWLYFTLGYTTVGFGGQVRTCSAFLHSDTLRFVAGPAK